MKVQYLSLIEQHQKLKKELLQAVEDVLFTSQFINGEQVFELEKQLAKLLGVKFVVGVNSGTDALILSLRAMEIQIGDEVIVPANSFLASAMAVALVGATPVFSDVKENYLLDEQYAEKLITSKTKAIMPVHLTGKPCNMEKIKYIADKYHLQIIEDCAQAIFAQWNGKCVGTSGDFGCFSLHPLKNLSACGDGGFIAVNDEEKYNKILQLRNIGLKNRNEAEIIGQNSRLDTLQASFVLKKLPYLQEWTKKRQENADFYRELFKKKNISEVIFIPQEQEKEKSVYHTFVIRVKRRDELQKFLLTKGIETKIHYSVPIHKQKCFYNSQIQLKNVEEQSREILSLPIHEYLKEEQIRYVVDMIEEFYSISF